MTLRKKVRGESPAGDQWKRVLDAVLRVSSIASSSLPLSDALQAMVEEAIRMLGAQQGSIMLLEDGGAGSLVLMAASGLPSEVFVGDRLPVGESVAGRVIASGKPLLLNDVQRDAFINFVPKARPLSSS